MLKTVKFIFIILFHFGLSGCAIPLAPFYDEPFPKELLAKLNVGASQEDVVQLLGTPHASRADGHFWYYGGTRPVVYLVFPEGGDAILDYNWLEVAFDNALRLQYAEHYESKSGCARSGNCLLWGSWDSVKDTMTELAIFTRPAEDDAAAKTFAPPGDGCAAYVYFSSSASFVARALLRDDVMTVAVGDSKPSSLNIDTYLRVEVPPGDVKISSGTVSKKEWHCETNDVAYFWVQGKFSEPDRIEKVDEALGKKEILRRKLLLPP